MDRQARTRATIAGLATAALLTVSAAPANAGVMDFLFGSSAEKAPAAKDAPHPKRREWSIGEFTAVRLQPAEAGAPANEHPAVLSPEQLAQALGSITITVKDEPESLFHADELKDLVGPLASAFRNAGPGDDVLLLSTSRRGGGLLSVGTGVTARLFVKGGELQVIVNDSRLDFVNAYRGTHIAPDFEFGSRQAAGKARLVSTAGTARRADWLAFPVAVQSVAASAAAPAPAPRPAPARAAVPAAVATPAAAAPAPPPPAAPAATAARDGRFFEEQEQRLRTLKRLREQNLISEDEFQQKRREILQSL